MARKEKNAWTPYGQEFQRQKGWELNIALNIKIFLKPVNFMVPVTQSMSREGKFDAISIEVRKTSLDTSEQAHYLI